VVCHYFVTTAATQRVHAGRAAHYAIVMTSDRAGQTPKWGRDPKRSKPSLRLRVRRRKFAITSTGICADGVDFGSNQEVSMQNVHLASATLGS